MKRIKIVCLGFFLTMVLNHTIAKSNKEEFIIQLGNDIQSAKLVKYSDFVIDKIVSDSSKTDRSNVESFVVSYLSANSLGWYNSFYQDNTSSFNDESIAKRSEDVKDGIKYELKDLLYFKLQKREFCVVKYYIDDKTEEGPANATMSLEKINNRWVIITGGISSYYNSLFFLFKSDYLFDILVNKKSNSLLLNDLISKSIVGGKFDVIKFFNLLSPAMKTNKDEIIPLLGK